MINCIHYLPGVWWLKLVWGVKKINILKKIDFLKFGGQPEAAWLLQAAYRSFSRPPPPLHCLAKSLKSAHANRLLVNATIWKGHCCFEMFCIYQPSNAHVRISNGAGGREKDL
jgi:hypothetical protein